MKIESGDSETFVIDGLPYQRGIYEPFVSKDGTRFGLKRQNGTFLVVGKYDEFKNSSDVTFENVTTIVAYVKTFIFINRTV